MFTMFRQMFSMLTMFFSAGENVASALNSLSLVGKEMADHYLEENRLEQQATITALNKQLKIAAK